MRGHAISYSTRIDGIVLSVTKVMFLVEKAKLHAWKRVMEIVGR